MNDRSCRTRTLSNAVKLLATLTLSSGASGSCASAADVLTQRNGIERTGAYSIPGFNQDLVKDRRWGLRGALTVNGTVYAQPLYLEGVTRLGENRRRDLVLVATAKNHLYAFDAGALGAPLWHSYLGANDSSKIGIAGCDGISGDEGIGIEATPVVDPARAHLFVSYRTVVDGRAQQRLRSVDVRTGASQGDVEVPAPHGVADWPRWNRSRASLLWMDGVVYVAFASRCEDPGTPPFYGWILAFDAESLVQVGTFSPSYTADPRIDGAGIWQGASGLAADGAGNIFVSTGNRRLGGCQRDPHDEKTAIPCDGAPPDAVNWADSVLRIQTLRVPVPSSAPGAPAYRVDLRVADWFSPYRKIWLDWQDLDLASSGPVLIPGSPYLVAAGKQGIAYVLDRRNLGRSDPARWTSAKLDEIRARTNATYSDYAEDFHLDKVVQKFQLGFNQYLPEGTPHLARPGAGVAAAYQNAGQLDLFTVGRDGAIWVTWEAGGVWTDLTSGRPGPARITGPGLAPIGAHVAAAKQNDHQLDAFVVGNDGAIWVTWEANDGRWRDGAPGWEPARISPPGLTKPGACVAVARQNAGQLDAFVVGNDGAVWVTWEANDGRWRDGGPGWDPARITPPHLAPPGAHVAAAKQNAGQLDAFVVGNDGAAWVTWEANDGRWRDGGPGWEPARITPTGLSIPGAPLAAAKQNDGQLDVFVMGKKDETIWVTWEANDGRWRDGAPGWEPARVTGPHFAPVDAVLAVEKQGPNQMDAFAVSWGGALWVTWEVNDGRWRDGAPGWEPLPLSRALWMNDWIDWPHVHGTPVFAQLANGPAMLYAWPEKDHLKGLRWLGDRFDAAHRVLGTDRGGQLLLAPPGPPRGMPGGMLAVVVDPGRASGGVVFGSIARVPDQDRGILRAFDPVTLKELWNNEADHYAFAKFVSPTIAGKRVLLPTAERRIPHPLSRDEVWPGQVLVYGIR